MKKHLIFVALLLTTMTAHAVPQLINYQGSLSAPDGTPLDTTVAITFTIYDAVLGGTSLWAETHPAVVVENGQFQVKLGSESTLPDLFSADRWLGIAVGADTEMIPREQMVSVAHAYRVGTVDGASGGSISGNTVISSKLNVGSGNSNAGSFANVFGENNAAGGIHSVVSGGFQNTASGPGSTVAGGSENTSESSSSVVSGGQSNVTTGAWSSVGGGLGNSATGVVATVGGGQINSATGDASFIGGGFNNRASGNGSFAAGYSAKAIYDHSFVWGSSSTLDSTTSFNDYTVTFRCQNGARFYTSPSGSGNNATGVTLPAGGGAWAALCDVNQKNLYGAVNTSDILQEVSSLPLHKWSYKSQDESIRHIGPTAQDFHAAFGLGDNNTTISTLDPDGVLFAAVQELAKQNQKQQELIDCLFEELQKLRANDRLSTNIK